MVIIIININKENEVVLKIYYLFLNNLTYIT